MHHYTDKSSSVDKGGIVAGPGPTASPRGVPEAPGAMRNAFTDRELADHLGISRKTLQKWRSLGMGPTYLKLGSKVVYRIEDVNAYIQRSLRIPSYSSQR